MKNKEQLKEGDSLTIRVKETVIREAELIIGEDIDIEDAEDLINLMVDSDEFTDLDNGYEDLNYIIGDDSCIIESLGYYDVEYAINDSINNIEED